MGTLMDRIYLSPPHMSGGELELVREAFESNWIAPLGPHVDAFEREFIETLLPPLFGTALSSGTAALHLALRIPAGETNRQGRQERQGSNSDRPEFRVPGNVNHELSLDARITRFT